ncbi:MAG: hypothetical protein J6Z43_02765 [Clostridiales bacterium]|nr:hypothetical protein [Clostridiales bacterium]
MESLSGKDWITQFRTYADPNSGCTVDELRQAYLEMALNYMNELVNTRQLENFVAANYGEEQVEKLAVEGELANRVVRIMCQYPDDLAAQADAVATFIQYNT